MYKATLSIQNRPEGAWMKTHEVIIDARTEQPAKAKASKWAKERIDDDSKWGFWIPFSDHLARIGRHTNVVDTYSRFRLKLEEVACYPPHPTA